MDFRTDILPLKDKLFRLALRITMCREDAEDVVQEVMIKLWKMGEKLQEIDSPEAFALTLCHNQAIDIVRKTSKAVFVDNELAIQMHPSENPYDKIYAQEDIRNVHRIMSMLPEKQRLCMHLRDFEGKSYAEIAEIMNITTDQVRINIFRARKFLKEKLSEK